MTTKGYLASSDYLPLASTLMVGATGRYNHAQCGDTRGRLYLTRGKEGAGGSDTVLAYCHNCGAGGRANLGGRQRYGSGAALRNETETLPLSKPRFSLPPGTTFERGEFGSDATQWLRRYELDRELPRPWVGYTPRHNRIVLPVWSGEGLEAYQTRTFDKDWKGPKYVTKRRDGADIPQPVALEGDGIGKVLVITEDTLSSIKIALAGYSGVPLWSAPHSNPRLLALSKMYENILVWFDNDNEQVRANAMRLARRLRAHRPRVQIVLDKSDPKCYTVDTIQEVLRDVL